MATGHTAINVPELLEDERQRLRTDGDAGAASGRTGPLFRWESLYVARVACS